MDSHDEQWWNIRRAAAYLDMSVAFLRKAVRQRRIPFARAGTKALRFRKQDLDRWLEGNGSGAEMGVPNNEGRASAKRNGPKHQPEAECQG
jgi:excisionase family DNA binding protein